MEPRPFGVTAWTTSARAQDVGKYWKSSGVPETFLPGSSSWSYFLPLLYLYFFLFFFPYIDNRKG
jgi:hypothetical protein